MALNRIILMGRLTKDPVLRHTQSGKSVCGFTLAVDRPGKDKVTDFIDCVAWGNTADFVNSYLSKGRMTAVEGRLQLRDWTDTNGNKRRIAEVVVDNVYFADSKTEKKEKPEEDPFSLDQFEEMEDGQFKELKNDDTLPF